jgi:hypothetical protein
VCAGSSKRLPREFYETIEEVPARTPVPVDIYQRTLCAETRVNAKREKNSAPERPEPAAILDRQPVPRES